MKPQEAIRQIGAALAGWRYIRFPTLTRPMLGAEGLPARNGENRVSLPDAFLARVMTCHARAMAAAETGDGAIWASIAARNRPFLDALASGEPSRLRPFADALYAGQAMMGMAHVQGFVTGGKTIYPRRYFGLRVRDSVLALAEALGVLGPPSNQQTPFRRYRDYLNQDLAPVIASIEAVIGHAIATPQVGCPPVVEIGDGLYNPDLIRHAYVPWRISQLGIGPGDPVLEIGGGYGCVARYAVLRGLSDWTIIDLPYVSAIQMLWLGAALGTDAVSGIGEPRAAIHLLPNSAKAELATRRFALALNMDSLPEISAEEAGRYLDLIAGSADRFLSVNQEARKSAQNSVSEMMRSRPMRRLARHPYWMEQGYVEELYVAATVE